MVCKMFFPPNSPENISEKLGEEEGENGNSKALCFISKHNNKIHDRSSHQMCWDLARPWHRCFPVKFALFSRTPFLQNISTRLLLKRIFQNWTPGDYCLNNQFKYNFQSIPDSSLQNLKIYSSKGCRKTSETWIPDLDVSTAILNAIDISRRWCKLNFGPLRG